MSEVEGPLALHIVRANGDCLTLGVSPIGCALSFVRDSSEPPYFVSVGTATDPQEINFFDGHEGPYFEGRNLVSLEVARAATLEFVDGNLSRNVLWEEV